MENELMRQATQKTGLKLIKIKSKDELEDLLRSGLNTLYADVFGGEPYNEIFSEEEVDTIFMDYFDKNGEIFVGICPATQKPVSFVVSTPLKYKFDIVQCPFSLIDRRLIENNLLDKLKKIGTEVHVRSIFLQGLLFKKNVDPYFFKWKKIFTYFRKWSKNNYLSNLEGM